MFGLKKDWSLDASPRYFTLEDYAGAEGRWCPGCGDFAVLTAVQRICKQEQIPTEKLVNVSGIGCSSRFPHYMASYGFHGLHGRAFPVACGVKARRPDLDVWVSTGDGDCCSIGAGHWIHAVRYNMKMVVMLFDNSVYGLTKKQSSPTSPVGFRTNTHPRGSVLPPLDPTTATLGMTNVSFVAQTVDWNPAHLYACLHAAWKHPGFAFVRILQRCPTYSDGVFEALRNDPSLITLVTHPKGVTLEPDVGRMYVNQVEHDPSDLGGALNLARRRDTLAIGLLYQNKELPRYDEFSAEGIGMSVQDKLAGIEQQLDRFAI